jgi:cytochrome c biogenesis protein CcmG/thiol:disulfide interchange protein DsbE
MIRRLSLPLALGLLLAACGGAASGESDLPDLPEASPDEVVAFVVDDGRPAVVNVWASWCGPCRAEAPLLTEAHAEYGDEVLFVGVDVQDSQPSAKEFIETYGLDFQHFFDADKAVPAAFGGFGVPITYFMSADGEILETHTGILDERSLVEGIEALLTG